MRSPKLTISLLWMAVLLGCPALASAAQSLAITSPTGFPAGGDPTYTTAVTLDTGAGAPSAVSVRLAPGVLASAAAHPSCVTGPAQHTATCEIGTGAVETVLPLPVAFTAYLVPPPTRADIVGIDLVSAITTTHAGAQLVQTAAGNVQTVLTVNLSSLGLIADTITGMTLTVHGTLDGQPFNRMPTNCHPGKSTLRVAYAQRTETTTAAPDFVPTGCGALPYSPHLTGVARQDAHDGGADVVTTVTQAVGQAASARTVIDLPRSTLAANLNALPLQNTTTPVGTATASTPLLPQPLRGKIFLAGTAASPLLRIRFPPPAPLSLSGVVSLAHNSVSIPVIPDVPLTSLAVAFPGGPRAALSGYCPTPSGILKGSFTGQNGKRATASQRLTLGGCRHS